MFSRSSKKISGLADYFLNDKADLEVFGMFGAGNLGDEAMLVAARAELGANRVMPWRSPPRFAPMAALIRARTRPHLVVGGGTLIHGGDTGWLDHVEMCSRQGMVISFLGTGMSFLPAEIEGRSASYRRWSELMRSAAHIHLRGPYSVDLSRRMGGDPHEFGDMAFLLHDNALLSQDHGSRDEIIGINVGRCLADQDRFERDCAMLVRLLSRRFRLAFHIVVDTDVNATERIIAGAGLVENSYMISHDYFDPYSFMEKVRKYHAFIGLKMHAAGLAMIAGVPALFMAYKTKIFDFLAPLGDTRHLVIDIPLDVERVINEIDELGKDPARYVFAEQVGHIKTAQRVTIGKIFRSEFD